MFYKLLNSYVQKFSFPKRGLRYFIKIMRFFDIAKKTYLKKLPGDIFLKVNPEEHIQQQLFWYGYYERSIGLMLEKVLKPDSVFVDIGANIGYFSLLAARLSPQGKVIAFEPVTHLYEAMQANVALNKFGNIELEKLAIGEKEETRIIYLSGHNNEGMSSFHKPENYSGENEMVNVSSLDSWIANSEITKTDVIKIDVEGSELSVLKGMKEVLKKFAPLILIELNPSTLSYFGLIPADVLSYVNEIGYKSFQITEKGSLIKLGNENISATVNLLLVHLSKSGSVSHLLN